ncbi:Uncharacterised protein [uncultured archaeon]|nr:Uncharacterised protein [uncultured archaeon]
MINDKNEVALAVLSSPGDMNSQVVGGDSRVTFSNPAASQNNVNYPTSGLKLGHFGSKDNADPYNDVRKHFDEIIPEAQRNGVPYFPFSTYGDVHEGTHGLNAIIRNLYGQGTGTDNAFYLLDGNYVIVKEPPGVTMTQAAGYVPSDMTGLTSYQTYLISQSGSWNNQPLNIMDEFTAYTNSEIYKNKWGGNDNVVNNAPDFTVYSTALGLAIEQNNPQYWNSEEGTKFKQVLALSIERANYANPGSMKSGYPSNIMTSQDQKYVWLKQFLQRNYPESWIRQNFGQ